MASDYKLYHVEFYEDRIETKLTSSAHIVDEWIREAYDHHLNGNNAAAELLFVGLDTEWRWDDEAGDYHVALIQLCDTRRRCLIFRFSQEAENDQRITAVPPQSLVSFLSDENIRFVGKSVKEDVRRLGRLGLRVACALDVSHMAADKYKDKSHKSKGLKQLAMEFLNKEMRKPKEITMSRWDVRELSLAQVQYACIDALVSLQLGILLSQEEEDHQQHQQQQHQDLLEYI